MTTTSLPAIFFHCPPLTRDESYKQQGIAAEYEVVAKTQRYSGPIHWQLNSDEGELKIYKGMDPSQPATSSNSTLFMATIEVVGTMGEVVDLFRSQSNEQAKDTSAGSQTSWPMPSTCTRSSLPSPKSRMR
ncbi:hypothetical protein AC1031_009231 [Aphanomyces cochlioides]|nr:hypothetical protein AC1031_009231 [Aphanomyces cochlioides]